MKKMTPKFYMRIFICLGLVVLGIRIFYNQTAGIQSWGVILKSATKESHKELVMELVRAFDFDDKEASDTLSNLPIVIVDHIDFTQAKAIKKKLEAVGAKIWITKYGFIKRFCYSIEWPQPPDLSYFDEKSVGLNAATPEPKTIK